MRSSWYEMRACLDSIRLTHVVILVRSCGWTGQQALLAGIIQRAGQMPVPLPPPPPPGSLARMQARAGPDQACCFSGPANQRFGRTAGRFPPAVAWCCS